MATYNIPHDVTCSSDAQENLRCSECGLTVRDAMRSTRKGNRYCRLCVTGRTDDEEADKELLVSLLLRRRPRTTARAFRTRLGPGPVARRRAAW
jgi:late competence protein required for DNA uptake (superfamily II DNA/RNA helicase)